MSDDEPMSEIEMLNAMRNMARLDRALYLGFVEEGYSETQAFTLAAAWVHGSAGGKMTA